MLSALQETDKLVEGSKFDKLALIMDLYLDALRNLPKHGIKQKRMAWHDEVMNNFEDTGLNHVKATYTVHERLTGFSLAEYSDIHLPPREEIEGIKVKPSQGTNGDPWKWTAKWASYKEKNKFFVKPYSSKYGIYEMTKAQRIKYSLGKKDGLAN